MSKNIIPIQCVHIEAESYVIKPEDLDFLVAQAERAQKQQAVLERLARYFKSGNDVPVERATIRAQDFWSIVGSVV